MRSKKKCVFSHILMFVNEHSKTRTINGKLRIWLGSNALEFDYSEAKETSYDNVKGLIIDTGTPATCGQSFLYWYHVATWLHEF
jgi:hypothetical protein